MPARGTRWDFGSLYSYVLYERISEMCFLPAGGAYAAGMPRGVNPTTRASAGIFRKDFTFSSLKAKIQEVPNPSLVRSEEHTSELQSPCNLVCRLLLEKKNPIDHSAAPAPPP